MKAIFTCLLLLSYICSSAQLNNPSERWDVELAANISYNNSLSISVEKTFIEGRWLFGPRLELVNLFNTQSYKGGDSVYQMEAQIRLRLAQIEYKLNNRIRLGVAPFWMLGPLPQRGYYKTPTSIYAHIQLKEQLSLETSFTSAREDFVMISLRKVI